MAEAHGDVKQGAAMTQAEMLEAFNLFDRLGSGKLKITTLDTLVRACGLTPSDVTFFLLHFKNLFLRHKLEE